MPLSKYFTESPNSARKNVFNPRKDASKTELYHGIPLVSSGAEHQKGETTTMQDDGITVDFIFYSTPRSHDRNRGRNNMPENPYSKFFKAPPELLLKGVSPPCSADEIRAVGGLPNAHHSSDHLPMLASFLIT